MRRIRALALGGVLFIALACPAATQAALITFTPDAAGGFSGQFLNDNDVALYFFELIEASTILASTTSVGEPGPDGLTGFDTVLTLLRGSTPENLAWIDIANDDADPENGVFDATIFDPLTGLPGVLLQAGNYALAVTQSLNLFEPLLGGFSNDDTPMFTCDPNDTACTGFRGFSPRFSGSLVITPVTPEPQPVPEPATLALLLTGLAGAALRRRRG